MKRNSFVSSPLALSFGLTREDFLGEVRGSNFVVHKLPEHIIKLYQAFGCNRWRLTRMYDAGVRKAIIFFHPKKGVTECYKVSLEDWVHGTPWRNRLANGMVEDQRLVMMENCEKV